LSVHSGPGTLAGTKTQAAVDGTASFDGLSISKAGDYTLDAGSGILTGDTSASDPNATPPTSHHHLTAHPPNTTAGDTISPAVEVRIRGQLDTVPPRRSSVLLSVHSGPGTLAGTKTQAAVDGTASFDGLSISKAGDYTLDAGSGILTGDTSA